MQQGMLLHSLAAPGTGVEVEQILCRSSEPLHIEALTEAWRRVQRRHEALRTRFRWDGLPAPVQEVLEDAPLEVVVEETTETDDRLLAGDRQRDLDLSGPPMRLRLFPGTRAWRMLWSFHHAILDGRSFPIVLHDVFGAYAALQDGREWQPGPPRARFEGFARHVAGREHAVSRAYWESLLLGRRGPDYPLAQPRGPVGSADFGAVERRLDDEAGRALQAWSLRERFSLNVALQAAWTITVALRTGSSDVLFGATRACRHAPVDGVRNMVGLLINTVPVRANAGATPVRDLLHHLREQWSALRPHELTPLTAIQQWVGRTGPDALFDAIVVFDTADLGSRLRALGGAWLDREFLYRGRTGWPLTLIGYGGDAPTIRLEYDRAAVADSLAADLLDETLRALTALPEAGGRAAGLVPVLAPAARETLLALAAPRHTFTPASSVPERVLAAARGREHQTAVRGRRGDLTYADLLERSARVARGLHAAGVAEGRRVGVMMDRTPDAVVAMMGVMRSGAAYVPIDLEGPSERVRYLAEDAQLALIIRDPAAAPPVDVPSTTLDELLRSPPVAPEPPGPAAAAYVMYTSGSTGRPKGVVVTHANVARLADACAGVFDLAADDVWSCCHSFAFDFSVWEVWCALMAGARTVIAERDEVRDPRIFADLVARERVTVLSQTPSAFRGLQDHLLDRAAGLALRYVVFGGEALDPSTLAGWFAVPGGPALVNMYGITETTVHVTFRRIAPADTGRSASVIGRPLPDLGILLLTPDGALAPPGAPAEMFVAGGGVSPGYLGRPDLTQERFLETPWLPGHRVYRTGDLARLLPGGDLEFLGRADRQVKVRGHRIEPGEVEQALRRHPGVRDARVVPRTVAGAPGSELAAYLLTDGAAPTVADLRGHLDAILPPYMIPTWFVLMDRFPLTPNAKLDVASLPDPEPRRPDLGVAFLAPSGALEEAIAAAWREALGLNSVGTSDNFFDLGGNSLILVRMAGLLRQRLAREVTVLELFEHPTIRALADHLAPADGPGPELQDQIAARAARKRRALFDTRKR